MIKHAIESAKAIMDDPHLAPEHLVEFRHNICKMCNHYSRLSICTRCGCVTAIKIRLRATRCPIGKWESVK
jgi:hypothetical protein